MLFFKMHTQEFESDRHVEHMVSCQEMQSGVLVVFLQVNSSLPRFLWKNDYLAKSDFLYISNYSVFSLT